MFPVVNVNGGLVKVLPFTVPDTDTVYVVFGAKGVAG